VHEIAEWLDKLGMSEYAQRFADNDIDFTILGDLTDQDLEKIGVASLGHRRKLLRAIAARDTGRAAPAGTSESDPAAMMPAAAPTAGAAAPLPSATPNVAGEAAISRCCSVTWRARPAFLLNSTPRSGATSSVPISTPPRQR
jgi:hypothetical protein